MNSLQAHAPAEFSATPDNAVGIKDPNTLYVLIVDDSSVMRDMLNMKLRELAADSMQLVIEQAESGDEAVTRAQSNAYDVIFMDVEMPGMSGLEACRQIKKFSASRVAMVSGRDAGDDHTAGHQAGCDNYLTKPPHDTDLRVLLRLASIKKLTLV